MIRRLVVTAAVLTAASAIPAVGADAGGCGSRNNNTYEKLLECVTVEGVREHQAAFQAIADANGGNRASGTPGYDASVDYAVEVFEAAGYDVTVQPFEFQTFIQLSATVLEQVAPPPGGPIETSIFEYSGSGDVTASVSLPTGNVNGCLPEDFAGFTAGDIALIERGACNFSVKAANAAAAGAVGVVIYNNAPGTINGTLGNDFSLDIPVTAVTQDVGLELVVLIPDLQLRLKTDTFRGTATTANVIAETPGGDPDNAVVVGAHLDSVDAGPGINDNGSGSAAILEVAENLRKLKPENQVRFTLWGAEESGLVGSTYYVDQLSGDELDDIALYLNFDMIGSPNHVFFVYDGDDSDAVGEGPGPQGSADIEQTFESFYAARGEDWKGTDFSGRSDYGPFIAEGIPSGGLFTGAEGIKTPEEAEIWGGTAGIAYDPCYHAVCDTFDNVNLYALDVNADAVAYATLTYAMSTEGVNGEPGRIVPGSPAAVAAQGGIGHPGDVDGGDHDHAPAAG